MNDDLPQSQVRGAMSKARSSHIHRLRQSASTIFDGDFKQGWFCTSFDRSSLPEFQELLGVTITAEGKKYPLLPPILFRNGPRDKEGLFLNSALVRVCVSSVEGLDRVLTYTQILKVVLFGPSSLSGKKSSGPRPYGVRWGLQEVTPGMIAFAAIIVSVFRPHAFLEYHLMLDHRLASYCLPMKTSH